MSPNTPIERLRAELEGIKRYCTSQIAQCQKDLADQEKRCIKRHQEVRELISEVVLANTDFKRQVAEHTQKVNALLKKLAKESCGD